MTDISLASTSDCKTASKVSTKGTFSHIDYKQCHTIQLYPYFLRRKLCQVVDEGEGHLLSQLALAIFFLTLSLLCMRHIALGALTGKGSGWGGSKMRTEATGYSSFLCAKSLAPKP